MKNDTEKYSLVGVNGNAFSIMAYTARAMRDEGFSRKEIDEFRDKCLKSSSYERLLMLNMEMIDKCNRMELR